MQVMQLRLSSEMAFQPYQPSNFFEGEAFILSWCAHCARASNELDDFLIGESFGNKDECPILVAAFDGGTPHWRYDRFAVPSCAAFVEEGQALPPVPCEYTIDMFGVAA